MDVLHPRRQPAWRQDRAIGKVRLQRHHVVQRQLAGEQVAQQVHAPLLQRPAEKRVHGEQAGQIDVVLGKCRAAGQRHAAKHALRPNGNCRPRSARRR